MFVFFNSFWNIKGTFGYDDFTIDWYEVFMAWGLDLPELKQLAMNAISFSSMSHEEKQVGAKEAFVKNVINAVWIMLIVY